MKTDFKSRPAYVRIDSRIQAHFMTCFLSLILFRYLEKALDYKYTCEEILTALREMNFLIIAGEGYIPTYTRTDLTDSLHEAFNFHTDYEIVNPKQMKKIFRDTKKQKSTQKYQSKKVPETLILQGILALIFSQTVKNRYPETGYDKSAHIIYILYNQLTI